MGDPGPRLSTPALPLGTIVEKLAGDAEYAAVVASEAAEVLQTTDRAHVALMRAQHELRDRLATRHVGLL